MTDRPTVPTFIEAKVYPKDALLMAVQVGTANDPETGEEFVLLSTFAGSSLVQLPDGRKVAFGWPALIDAARSAAEEVPA